MNKMEKMENGKWNNGKWKKWKNGNSDFKFSFFSFVRQSLKKAKLLPIVTKTNKKQF